MKPEQIGVISLTNEDGELIAIIKKDPVSRKNIFYSCTEMGFDELEGLFKKKDINI